MSQRLLTEDEIMDILSFIKPQKGIPEDSALSIIEINKKKLYNQLKKQKVYPSIISKLKESIIKNFYETKIQPGESVGVICAMAIGEKNTQSTLNTFHKSGQTEKQVSVGVPRFQELLNATREPKLSCSKIFFNKKHSTIQDLRQTIGHNLVEITFKKISKSISICMNKKPEPWFSSFKVLYKDQPWYRDFDIYTDCISIKINTDILYEYKMTMEQIAKCIESEYDDLVCVFSPDKIGELCIFVDTSAVSLPEERILFINTDNYK
jgi:hypothetical protein